ncbi:hypothetical protein NQZ68_030881 [Dissostichus eleginoides]|nr:hypothetical protein NQZ68_030881 [Dissostichus eleginoides]
MSGGNGSKLGMNNRRQETAEITQSYWTYEEDIFDTEGHFPFSQEDVCALSTTQPCELVTQMSQRCCSDCQTAQWSMNGRACNELLRCHSQWTRIKAASSVERVIDAPQAVVRTSTCRVGVSRTRP